MTTYVNHNYPRIGALRPVSLSGVPLAEVEIRVYPLEKFLAGDTSTLAGETTTNSDGEWVSPIALESGRSWAIHFQKLDTVEPSYREVTT